MGGSSLSEAYDVGRRHEEGLDDDARRQGAHYTAPDVAEMLVERSLVAWRGEGVPVVCDPACGGGVFLVAAAEALQRRGVAPTRILAELVVGNDVDPAAAAAAQRSLTAWAAGHGLGDAVARVTVGDALGPGYPARLGPVDIVVGNPPFRNQLGDATARSAPERSRLAERFGSAAAGYVDIASLFELVGLDLVGVGGVVTLIQPRSFLVARDSAAVRAAILDRAVPAEAWLPGVAVFDANVDVCAVVLRREEPLDRNGSLTIRSGRLGGTVHGSVPVAALCNAPTWSPVWARANDVPKVVAPEGARCVGSVATATAGFRDQYYGLLAHLRDDEPRHGAPVVTTAMIEPARNDWRHRQVTIARQRRRAPWLDLDALSAADERLSAWVERVRVPKVLVATQTRVLEAAADPSGTAVPLTPVIAVMPHPSVDVGVHHLVAALSAPAATAWALERFGGAGMSSGALKLAARQVLEMPLPTDRAAWDAGASLVAGPVADWDVEQWRDFGTVMNEAWAEPDKTVVTWWLDRLRRKIDRMPGGSIH